MLKISLHLNNTCLETEVRLMYERCIKAYLSKAVTDESRRIIEEKMVPLHYFLEHADFPALRSLNPELSGIEALPVVLHIFHDKHLHGDEDAHHHNGHYRQCNKEVDLRIVISAHGRTIQPIWKKNKGYRNG